MAHSWCCGRCTPGSRLFDGIPLFVGALPHSGVHSVHSLRLLVQSLDHLFVDGCLCPADPCAPYDFVFGAYLHCVPVPLLATLVGPWMDLRFHLHVTITIKITVTNMSMIMTR